MSRVRAWLAVWTGWTALALFLAAGNSLTYKSTGRPANWALSIERSLADYWLWALLTPSVAAFTRRFPLRGPRFWLHLALHVWMGALYAVLQMIASRAIVAMLTGFWTYMLSSTVAFNFVIYVALVAAVHGLEFYHRSRERDQLETRLTETRLQLLGMQLQPHFLFNTLNTIAELVHEDPNTADAMIAHLSDLLRRTLEMGNAQRIALDDELDLVSRYLDIQKARFGERLRVTISIDDRARTAQVPPLLLQPIVENAIRHGLGARLESGRIDIEARIAGSLLAIVVTDDGEGPLAGNHERVGLGNTRARLDALYGARARLELAPADGRGTRATIQLPLSVEDAAT